MFDKVITYDLETAGLVTETGKEEMEKLLKYFKDERIKFKEENKSVGFDMISINERYGSRIKINGDIEVVNIFSIIKKDEENNKNKPIKLGLMGYYGKSDSFKTGLPVIDEVLSGGIKKQNLYKI